ncbi:hypothetical protein LSH36_1058g00017 [Paralvinella palmiformis]|uniref:Uncharacterized protein n=1 Tax=Paralvinella palmiformis TaxID=53620 RepID=A0AAD9IVG0_9ANNE|nr:hypothetical protein LSH36_1058g00017 [Paralvinella palmiformis]
MHCDKLSFDYVGISELFRYGRGQRIRLHGYHNITTQCRDTTYGCRDGAVLFIKECINNKSPLMYLYL